METSLSPGMVINSGSKWGKSFLTRGSPPVKRILSTPKPDGNTDEAKDLLVCQDVFVLQFFEATRRHAVEASKVAPVRNGDAKVIEGVLS